MSTKNAPIALFAYARPDHTYRTLEALAANDLALKSDLFIFIDGARSEEDNKNTLAVRQIAERCGGFARIEIIQRSKNFGLARNIIDGVTEIIERYGRVIVVEDDIVTSPNFLKFMNLALDKYVDVSEVWHISGWTCPIDPKNLPEAFFWRGMNCWGWATWSDRWINFDKDPDRLIKSWSKSKIKRFNLDGAQNFWSQVLGNKSGRLNTWAIFWYATIFENGGLCLNPSTSLVLNIGLDGTGENCVATSAIKWEGDFYSHLPRLPCKVVENEAAAHRIYNYYRITRGSLIRRILKNLLRVVRRNAAWKL